MPEPGSSVNLDQYLSFVCVLCISLELDQQEFQDR